MHNSRLSISGILLQLKQHSVDFLIKIAILSAVLTMDLTALVQGLLSRDKIPKYNGFDLQLERAAHRKFRTVELHVRLFA